MKKTSTRSKSAVKGRSTAKKRAAVKPKGLHQHVTHHTKRIYHATPKFIHGMVVGGIVGLLVVGFLGSSFAHPGSASATVDNNKHCDVTAPNPAKTFKVNNNTITATFTVTGTCSGQDVTLVSWQASNATDGKPYSSQVLYAHTTATLQPGERSLTTGLPNCYFQVDLILGPLPTGHNGGAGYATGGILRRSLHGGTKACTQSPPVTPPVTPPTTPVVVSNTATSLPNTGPGAILVVLGLSILFGYAFHIRHHHLKKHSHAKRAAH